MAPSAAEIADEVYGLAPEEFTAARDRAARAAREAGARDVADEVKRFRRPTVGAWLVNQVVRSDDDRLDQLLDLGAALREAQDALDGEQLRAMSRQRHQVIRGLSELAREITGRAVGDAAQREFEATLEAALADDAAAEAVRTGRLMRPLVSSGLEPVDLTDAVAAPGAGPARRPRRAKGASAKAAADNAAAPKSSVRARDERKRRAELDRAQQRHSAAEQQVRDREQQAADARSAADEARRRVAELEAALEAARADQNHADRARRDADAAVKAAARDRDDAHRELLRLQRRRS